MGEKKTMDDSKKRQQEKGSALKGAFLNHAQLEETKKNESKNRNGLFQKLQAKLR